MELKKQRKKNKDSYTIYTMLENLFNYSLYINLEHRTDRLAHVVSEMHKMGINASRFNAIKTTDGAVGCSMSHLKCVEQAKNSGAPYVFICEDDIQFLNPELFKTNLQKFLDTGLPWDVIIVSGNVCPPYSTVGDYAIKITNCQTTTGYIVAQHYIDTILANFKEGVQNLLRDPKNKREYAIDVWWKSLQASGNWYMIIPPTVIQLEGFSDIEQRFTDYKHLMTDMTKEWLFKPIMQMQAPSSVLPRTVESNVYFNSSRPTEIQHNNLERGFDLGIKFRGSINGKLKLNQ